MRSIRASLMFSRRGRLCFWETRLKARIWIGKNYRDCERFTLAGRMAYDGG
jgi:hypothetical protein